MYKADGKCYLHCVMSVSTGASQKSNPLAALQYGQLIGNTSLQPSQMFVQYDPGQPVNAASHPAPGAPAPPGPPNQNVIGSQLIQQR